MVQCVTVLRRLVNRVDFLLLGIKSYYTRPQIDYVNSLHATQSARICLPEFYSPVDMLLKYARLVAIVEAIGDCVCGCVVVIVVVVSSIWHKLKAYLVAHLEYIYGNGNGVSE